MHNAIYQNKTGVAIMADFEGAFDATWREGVLYKLSKAGISGNLLDLFGNYVSGLKQNCVGLEKS